MKIIKQKTKTLVTRENGRSSDAVSPNFVYGCLGGCMSSYCYVGRYNHDKVYINENTEDILNSIADWVDKQPHPKTPNQCDPSKYVIDIGCSTDVPLLSKHYPWEKVFNFFNDRQDAKATFATKYPSMFRAEQHDLTPDKHRIRLSLMPQKYSDVLEPGTDPMLKRLMQFDRLNKNMEVHINFSPIIFTDGWLKEYRELFEDIRHLGVNPFMSECIFLTYNNKSYERASPMVNELLWRPDIQEKKDSQYAKDNIRYQYKLKNTMVQEFKLLYSEYFDPETIRYIF